LRLLLPGLPLNQRVPGSSPGRPTNQFKGFRSADPLFCVCDGLSFATTSSDAAEKHRKPVQAQGHQESLGGSPEGGQPEAWVRRSHRGEKSRGTGTANSLMGARGGWIDGEARSGGLPDVAMVQATDFGNWEDRAEFRRRDWPSVRCVLVERKMGSR